MPSFADNLRRARLAAGMTQHQLAEALGISRSTIANIERDRRDTSLRTACALADVLGVSLSSLVGDSQDDSAAAQSRLVEQSAIFRTSVTALEGARRELLSKVALLEVVIANLRAALWRPGYPEPSILDALLPQRPESHSPE